MLRIVHYGSLTHARACLQSAIRASSATSRSFPLLRSSPAESLAQAFLPCGNLVSHAASDQRRAFSGAKSFGPSRKHGKRFVPRAKKSVESTFVYDSETRLGEIRKAVDVVLSDRKLHGRIASWGLSGAQFASVAANTLLPRSSAKIIADDKAVVRLLLAEWWRNAERSLSQCVDEEATDSFWNGKGLAEIRPESVLEELPRLIIASFLRWLEQSLAPIPEATVAVAHLQSLRRVADLRYPSLDFPNARTLKRNIHLHVGPTNSGKTYRALVALCQSHRGVYCGPLRLLAHEIWDRINSGTVAPGIPARPCNLLTGEEEKVTDIEATLLACTVEMLNPGDTYDVAVIDEIQMIGDVNRGFAWTEAVLGVNAREVHLCGEKSVIPLIQQMADACEDNLHVHEYERLTPLRIADSLGSLKNVQKGDCVVAFSRSGIFDTKETIERLTGLKCAVAYGALPPETKAEQAKLFNDPTNDIDVMVASDAIGMGLNLKIKRIIFTTVRKWNGKEEVTISFSQLKQIAGRAGRFDTGKANDKSGGFATTIDPRDLPVLEQALEAPLKPIKHASISARQEHMEALATILPFVVDRSESSPAVADDEKALKERSLEELQKDMDLLMQIDPTHYYADSAARQMDLVPVIEQALPKMSNLTLAERDAFVKAPVNLRDEDLLALVANMTRCYSRGGLIRFEEVEDGIGLLSVLNMVEKRIPSTDAVTQGGEAAEKETKVLPPLDVNVLMVLETLHRGLTLYMWLSMRFTTSFCYGPQASALRGRCERAIDYCLEQIRVGRRQRLSALGRTPKSAPGPSSRPSSRYDVKRWDSIETSDRRSSNQAQQSTFI